MYYGTLAVACEGPGIPDEIGKECILSLVEAFARIDEVQMRFRPMPPLYQAGVRYKEDVEAIRATVCGDRSCGDEVPVDEWQDATTLLEKRLGNCKDLVAYRVAELRLSGDRSARPAVLKGKDPSGRIIYHVVLLHGDGKVEDPSAALGMKTPW